MIVIYGIKENLNPTKAALSTVIEINMVEGRAIATQKALIKALFQHIVSTHRVGGRNRTDRYRNHHKRAASALLGGVAG